MKQQMNASLIGKPDLVTLADIAEIALEQEQNEIAKNYAL
jgi:hypothetical protein